MEPIPAGNADGVTMVEVLIPGNKVGLVIGKGGETIKGLQENAGVKMVMIQDSNQPSHYDKPLRITGEMSRCQVCREQNFFFQVFFCDRKPYKQTVQTLSLSLFLKTVI